jgi:YNFM family putative membrane transporter
VRLLPRSRHFAGGSVALRELPGRIAAQLTEPGLARLNLTGALLIAVFVGSFNALGFRLSAAPYLLGQAALAAIFLVYAGGSASSAIAGRLADRFGRRRVLPAGVAVAAAGLALTAASSLPLVVAGIATLTAGFFAAHSVASSWVGRRAAVGEASQASALYMLSYYAGASAGGPLAGAAWSQGGWDGVLVLSGALLLGAFALALRLARTPPRVAVAAS